MIRALKAWFILVLVAMVAVTTWASLQESIVVGGARLLRDPWGLATLFDAYFAFTAFWLWLAWREGRWAVSLAWLVGIYLLGNLAMASYVLLQLARLQPAEGVDALFRRRTP